MSKPVAPEPKLDAAAAKKLYKACKCVLQSIEYHHERGRTANVEPHSAITETLREALGLPEGPYMWEIKAFQSR